MRLSKHTAQASRYGQFMTANQSWIYGGMRSMKLFLLKAMNVIYRTGEQQQLWKTKTTLSMNMKRSP